MRKASPRALAPFAQKDSKKILTFSLLNRLILCKLDFQPTNGDFQIDIKKPIENTTELNEVAAIVRADLDMSEADALAIARVLIANRDAVMACDNGAEIVRVLGLPY